MIYPRLFKGWIALSKGKITIHWIRVTETIKLWYVVLSVHNLAMIFQYLQRLFFRTHNQKKNDYYHMPMRQQMTIIVIVK